MSYRGSKRSYDDRPRETQWFRDPNEPASDRRRGDREYDDRSSRSRHERSRSPVRRRLNDEVEEGEITAADYGDSPIEQRDAPPQAPQSATVNSRVSASAVAEPSISAKDELESDVPLTLEAAEPDPEAVLAARRAQRAAILAKYKPPHAASPSVPGSPLPTTPVATTPAADLSGIDSAPASAAFDLIKGAGENEAAHQLDDAQHEISAADYDPDEDRRRDDERQLEHRGHIAQVGATGATAAAAQTSNGAASDESEYEEIEVEEEDDMMDMFAESAPRKVVRRVKKAKASNGSSAAVESKPYVPIVHRGGDAATTAGLLVDNFDDDEGYYRVILGELLDDGRYHVHANLGKGMFSHVVRAIDTTDQHEVAIKIVRSQETMFKAGQKEAGILRRLQEADPDDRKHIVRLERTFEHRGHLCLVFESLSLNLREVVKRFGKDVGLNLKAVRAYAHQMFLGLAHMKKCNIMHADLKPDNILVTESKAQLKICDLGSASDTSENEITPYLVSRFYRAPEIILGLPYDCALDTWAIGCTLYELYTGKILFPGRTNNHMLLLIQELVGRLNSKTVKRSKFGELHFDELGNFLSLDRNKNTGADTVRKMALPVRASNDLRTRLMASSIVKSLSDAEVKMLSNFVDLLTRCLDLDPAKRIAPKEALAHPFLR